MWNSSAIRFRKLEHPKPEHELIGPDLGDKRFGRGDDQGRFTGSADVGARSPPANAGIPRRGRRGRRLYRCAAGVRYPLATGETPLTRRVAKATRTDGAGLQPAKLSAWTAPPGFTIVRLGDRQAVALVDL